MAATAVTSSSAKPLDPLRQNKFALHVSDGLLSKPRETTAYSTIKYNHKPRLSVDNARTATISQTEDERASLVLTDRSGDGASSEWNYVGHRKDLKRSYALVFNQEERKCTLEPLASSYSFNVKSTPTESSASRLAERYPKLKFKSDVGATGRANSDVHDVDPNGPADEGNPFDFRHFMKRGASRSVSPDAPRSHASTPLNGAGRTPLSQQAMGTVSPMVGGKRSTVPPRRRSPPAGTTLSKSKTSGAPEVRLERRASTRPAPSGKKGGRLPKSVTNPKKNPTVKSNEFIDSSDDDDEPAASAPSRRNAKQDTTSGGLEIDFGDSAPTKVRSRVSTTKKKGVAPISLRSAASSAAASPALRVDGRPLQKLKSLGDGQVIDFGDVSAVSNDEESYEEDSSEDAPGEDDHDIEPITLGSPAHETRSASASRPPEDRHQEDEVDAEGDDENFDDAFEEAYQQLSEADGDMDTAPPVAPVGEESEESEEE